jgi:hypothetical protein
MCGWIKIHRSIKDHWLYTEKRTFSKFEAWHDILIMVNFTDAKAMIKGKLYDIKRGQSILSLESWGKRWNWDKSKVRRFMNALQSDAMIVLESDNITTRLTVCKYETYQGERNANETQVKHKRTSNEHQTTPIEEEEEQQEEQEKKEYYSNEFIEVWEIYHKRGNKKKSQELYNKLTNTKKELVKNHLPLYIKNHIENDKLDYLKHFTTYLNGEVWNDELPYASKTRKPITPRLERQATLDE